MIVVLYNDKNFLNFFSLILVYYFSMSKKLPDPNFHRKNGLSLPLDPLQVMTWFIAASPLISFFAIQFPFLPRTQTYFWIVIFFVCYIAGIVLFVIATFCEHRLPPPSSPDHVYFCRYCKEGVPLSAKHCRMCNKCRCGFDHHCRFINNCVTSSNYLVFFIGCLFLVSTSLIGIAHLIVSALEFKNHQQIVLDRQTDYYHRKTSKTTFWIVFSVSLLLYLIILTPMMTLVIYHMYFQRMNISTYDHIIRNYVKYPQKLQSFWCSPAVNHKITTA